MMDDYRKVVPIDGVGACPTPGPAPEIAYLEGRQLVINEEYQRELSRSSLRQIRHLAVNWDWASFKAPNVARTDDPDVYEIVDGQHTAIAAVTNGNIPFLPCLVSDATLLKDKAQGFIGINTRRLALTPAAIFNARVAAQNDDAIGVQVAMNVAGVRMLSTPPAKGNYKVGDTLAVAAMLDLARKASEARLTRVLRLAVSAQAAPISAGLIKALDVALTLVEDPQIDNRVMVVLRGQGVSRLEMIAKARTPHGRRTFETLADMIADFAKLPEKRMGRERKLRGRRPKAQG